MQAISERKTIRDFKMAPVSDQMLSDLLYAGCGISHAGKRTIPTALNKQDIILYVLLPNGAYRYTPTEENHGGALILVSKEDLRSFATKRPGMGMRGSLTVVVVGDKNKWKDIPDGVKFTPFHAGCAVENMYLYCASAG